MDYSVLLRVVTCYYHLLPLMLDMLVYLRRHPQVNRLLAAESFSLTSILNRENS